MGTGWTVAQKNGAGVAAPSPDTIAFSTTALSQYIGSHASGNQNEQLLVVPRALVEDAIQSAIDWLDAVDRSAEQADGKAEAPENAL